jgi:SAM-dependent methyltransferase
MAEPPKLYGELAPWFHLLTAPEEYAEEAERYRRMLTEAAERPVHEVLELGSGGGNNASHLKAHFAMTLTDVSEDMLAISRDLNPECEHIQGDMRTLRLDQRFDAVFAHDAVSYLTSRQDVEAAVETAFVHLRPGGVALFVPDHISETFLPATGHGGNDGEGRALRYLEWDWDPDPSDEVYFSEFAYLLREGDDVRAVRNVPTGEEGDAGSEAFLAVKPRDDRQSHEATMGEPEASAE